MKKLFILLLIGNFFRLHAYSINDLELKIKESDSAAVKTILNEVHILSSDRQRLLIFADDIMHQRRVKYKSHFCTFKSISVIFELSKKQLMIIAANLAQFLAIAYWAIQTDKRMADYLDFHYHVNMQPSITDSIMGHPLSFLSGLLGGGTIASILLKHYHDVKKLYDNSIEIKQLICKAKIFQVK